MVRWQGQCALALHRAKVGGIEVARLITFYDETSGRVRFHATRVEMLQAQASAARIELRAIGTSWLDVLQAGGRHPFLIPGADVCEMNVAEHDARETLRTEFGEPFDEPALHLGLG